MLQESGYSDFSSREFPNNITTIMCAKAFSVEKISADGCAKDLFYILPPPVAPASTYKAWQENQWRYVALHAFSCVLVQMQSSNPQHVCGEEQKRGKECTMESTRKMNVLQL